MDRAKINGRLLRALSVGFFLILYSGLPGCKAGEGNEEDASRSSGDGRDQVTGEFRDYWYQGKAEISRFALEQSRYGEKREGNVVLVFVTEPFLTETQVKKEGEANEPATSVLKLNFVRDFTTGIYDYNMMSSVFLPVDRKKFQQALKLTTSCQEWCGQSYMQLNNRKEGYKVREHSYFQDIADREYTVDKTHLEDEIWTLIRMGPHELPLGDVEMIPGTQFTRLNHIKAKPRKAKASLDPYRGDRFEGGGLSVYRVKYKDLQRTVRIVFEKNFPFRIVGFEMDHKSGFGDDQRKMTTRGRRTHSIRSAYWEKNGTGDIGLRKELGLDPH